MATMCTVSASMSPWLAVKSRSYRGPSAALAYGGGSRRSSLSLSVSNDGPSFLHSSFLSSSFSLDFNSSFSGLSLGVGSACGTGMKKGRCFRLVVRAGKAALCLTKRNRSRKSLARTHGFRRRMRTTSGRAMLKRRRAKGRRILCTKTNPSNYRGRK